jgi:hypothetical protein
MPSCVVGPKVIGEDIEIDGFAVGGPGACIALAVRWSYRAGRAGTVERNDLALGHIAARIHEHDEDETAVGRKIRMMDHAALARREVNIPAIATGLVGSDENQMHAVAHFGKKQAFALVNPGQGR